MDRQFAPIRYEADLSRLVDSLPGSACFPSVIQKASRLAKEPHTAASDLAAIIKEDPLLTAGILHLANSPLSGQAQHISDIRECILALGFPAVRSFSVVIAATSILRGTDSHLFRYGDFWLHSLCTALLAQRLSRLIGISAVDEAFAAGFLHDIGKAVLHQFARASFTSVLSMQREKGTLDQEMEIRFINTTHAEIGRRLAEKWHLPMYLCEAIGDHHGALVVGPEPAITAICSISDYLCSIRGAGSLPSVGCPPRPDLLFPNLSCNSKAVLAVQQEIADIRDRARIFLRGFPLNTQPPFPSERSEKHAAFRWSHT